MSRRSIPKVKRPKERNPMAFDLGQIKYRQRIIPNKKKLIPRKQKRKEDE
jgi:hypothetical protein